MLTSVKIQNFLPSRYLPIDWIQCNRSWNLQIVLDQNLTHVAVEVGQLDRRLLDVGKVDVVVDPIHGQPVRGDGLILDDHRLVGPLVNWRPSEMNNER